MQFPKPEIMSPAGHWPQLRAAVEAGADSVYFGLKHFTARAKVGFDLSELPDVMGTLHSRGVKGFVTFNTLVFDHELREAARALTAICEAGADAIIVQDLGVLRMAREIAPEMELHASTQMSITDAAGVRMARELGASRVTLGRELSLKEIRAIRETTDTDLEIFVHGALCVAYSGQCFSSEAWGGRSANRGQCAQACRLEYDLIVDGHQEPIGAFRYLLSPGDLYALHQVPEMVDIGISALKIEGRYKDPEYVALVTRAYRKAVDEAFAGLPIGITPKEEVELEQVYSRGLGPYFISGTNHQKVVSGRAPRHRGVLMGRVLAVHSQHIEIEPSVASNIAPLKAGDGLVFDAADWRSPAEPEEGGRVFEVRPSGRGLDVFFGRGCVNPSRIRPGDQVWRTSDPDTERAARPFVEATSPLRRQPVDVRIEAHEGQFLLSEWHVGNVSAIIQSPSPLSQARDQAVSEQLLRDQLGRLGGTAYELRTLTLTTSGRPFAPVSLLNQLRREAVAVLTERQQKPKTISIRQPEWNIVPRESKAGDPQLHLLVRTPQQLEAAIAGKPASITLDYLDLYGLKPSVEQVKDSGVPVRVASPRILKPGEDRIADFLVRLDCPLLIRSSGLLHMLEGRTGLTGDFSLNAANAMTADVLLDRGLERITPTHDLNGKQITTLAEEIGGGFIEAIAFGNLPVFHTEHCVFCRFLSTGTTYRDCGRPCEKHLVALRDTAGRQHPVIADIGCRNTVFGAEAQEASAHMEAWLRAGIQHFRLEFVHQDCGEVAQITALFKGYLSGRVSAGDLGVRLRKVARQGTTEGSLFVPQNYQQLPVLQ